MKKIVLITFLVSSFFALAFGVFSDAHARPIISGISTNEINIDTDFRGAKILLFGAKGDVGNIVVAVRGPKKTFLVTRKQKLLGIWYNGERVKFNDSPSYYSLFSTFDDNKISDDLLSSLELGTDNLQIKASKNIGKEKEEEFQLQLIHNLEKNKLYSLGANKIDFLDESLFKVILDFPKNVARGVYTVEIYLISDDNLISFQSIPIYVNQIGISAKISDYAYKESLLYGLMSVIIALVIGWLANYLFVRFIGK